MQEERNDTHSGNLHVLILSLLFFPKTSKRKKIWVLLRLLKDFYFYFSFFTFFSVGSKTTTTTNMYPKCLITFTQKYRPTACKMRRQRKESYCLRLAGIMACFMYFEMTVKQIGSISGYGWLFVSKWTAIRASKWSRDAQFPNWPKLSKLSLFTLNVPSKTQATWYRYRK